MKFSMKRLAALVMALVMVIGLLPVVNNTASALNVDGSLTDSSIGLSYVTGGQKFVANTKWTAEANTLTGSAQGTKNGSFYLKATNTLTITNNKSDKATLSFNYKLSGALGLGTGVNIGTISIDSTVYNQATEGSFSKELEAGESIIIVLTTGRVNGTVNTITAAITDLNMVGSGGGAVKTTFEAPAYGSYTIAWDENSKTLVPGSASEQIENLSAVKYTLTCTPGVGNKFVGWYNSTTDQYVSVSTQFTAQFENPGTIKPIVVPETAAVFLAGMNYFSDLDAAVTYAQANALNQITLVSSGTITKSEKGIPAGITLLIPKDATNTLTPWDTKYDVVAPEYEIATTTPYAYMTLTLADGVTLNVSGSIDVEAKHTTLQGSGGARPYGGRVCGPYGAIFMSPNSKINLNSGANLYAWGFVYGEGSVVANSGAKVYEYMQVTDFPGGGNASGFMDTDPEVDTNEDGIPDNDYVRIFPFQQYYVQNIEVPLTLHNGASEFVYATVTAGKQDVSAPPIEFIGANGMFVPGNGTIVKDYDPSTDRMIIDVNGDASMNGIALDMANHPFGNAMAGFLEGITTFDSSGYILLLNGNITININAGTTTIGQDMALMPGVEIYVKKDATLVISAQSYEDGAINKLTPYGSFGHNIYVFDRENWNKPIFSNAALVAASYSPTTGRYKRTAADLKDVIVDINGTLITNGFVYSTVTMDEETWLPVSGGAAIISSGKTGKVIMQNGAGTEEFAYVLDGSSAMDLVTIASAWLKNGDGTFLQTVGAEPGASYNYCDVHDLWYTEGHGNCVPAPTHADITWIINGVGETMEIPYNTVPVYPTTPTMPQNGCTVYTFAGWSLTEGGEILSELPVVTGEAAYFAIFTESISHIGDNNKDHKCDGCPEILSSCVDGDDKNHNCDYTGCNKPNVDDGCHGGTAYCNAKPVCAECGKEYGAINSTNHAGTATYFGNVTDTTHTVYYSCCDAEKLTEGHKYVNGVCDCEAKQSFTITWVVDGNATTETYKYGQMPTFKGNTDKAANGCTTYTFIGWDKTPATVTGTVTYTAQYESGISHIGDNNKDHKCDGCPEILSSCVDGDDKNHNCDYTGCNKPNVDGGCHGGTAYCNARPICAECGQKYGAIAQNNHAYSDSTYYGDITDKQHTVYYSCCDNAKVTENHKYVTGICDCGARQSFTITWVVDGNATTETYKYGEMPTFKGNTDKAANGCTTYTFIGWDKTPATVTGTVTYTAQYESGISHIGQVKYINNGDGTHSGAYECCGVPYVTNEAHKYVNGVCVCGQLEHICADNLTFHAAVTPNCCNGGNNAYYSCSCGKFYSDANASNEIAKDSWILGKDSTNHTGTVGYSNNGADHTASYSCCGESWSEDHTYVNGTCVCDALKVSKLTVVYGVSGEYKIELMVPYGTRLFDVVDFDVVSANIYVHSADRWGRYEQSSFYGCFDNSGNLGYLYYFGENYIMPDCDFYIEARYVYNGFIHDGIGWQYIEGAYLPKDEMIAVMMGDLYEGGSFEELEGLYAFDENGYRIENGLFRDYYAGEWINGVTYAPNAEDIAYYESKGMTFIDAEQTWYYFGADGKWAYNYTGRFGNSYIVNGHAAWHVGLVEIDGEYYYFKGDEVNGGNVMVTDSDHYITRKYSDADVVLGGDYTFGTDGKLCRYEGIQNVNGTLRYYVDGQWMHGIGLTQVGENYIHVNSYGELIVDAEYYVGANSFGLEKGIYYFDENGFLVMPEPDPVKEGFYYENGAWYYYVGGMKSYCAGLIETDGILWYETAESQGEEIQGWVYVRSDGSLATGIYYITNTNGHATIASGTKCTFDNNGIMIDPVIGAQVLEEGSIRDDFNVRTEVTLKANGKLTIDVSNIFVSGEEDVAFDVEVYGADGSYYDELVRGEGIAEFDLPAGEYAVRIYIAFFHGAEDDDPGYGRGSLDYKITFTGDGTPLNGIVDGYYYVDGHIAYAAGLIEIDGIYYYVRSNGQIVTDCQYWITNVNDTGYEPGLYEFDEDGWMREIYVETFTGIKDGYFYIEDAVAYNAGLMQYNGGYIYVRSNGQIATGKYWITNHNDLLPEGFYDFGENGVYYPAIPGNAHLLMEVDKNVDTDGFWDSNAIANAVRPSADGHLYVQVTDVTCEYEPVGQGGFCIEFEGSYWVMQWDAVYKVGNGTVMIPVSAGEDVILFVNPADICEDYVDSVYGTISYKVWSDVECELVQGGIGE